MQISPIAALYSQMPVLQPPAADPWIFRHEGCWYSLQAVGRTLQVKVAGRLAGLNTAEACVIWKAPATGGCSRNLWAPEMHRIGNAWYLYVAADDGRNENHRMWALEGETPMGPWRLKGRLETPGWAIDGSVMELEGELFCAWSGWPGADNGRQNLYLARMNDPWTLDGPGVCIAEPEEAWEQQALPLCEGPQWLHRGEKTFLVYSASGSWTPDYCLGMLVNDEGDWLDRRAWQKVGPVFERTERVWGVGHCCFATDEEGRDLLFYHAKTSLDHGWDDRQVLVQRFGWDDRGYPCFGWPGRKALV